MRQAGCELQYTSIQGFPYLKITYSVEIMKEIKSTGRNIKGHHSIPFVNKYLPNRIQNT